MTIKNFTPHALHFFRPEELLPGKIRGEFSAPGGAKPYLTIPSDGAARVVFGQGFPGPVTSDGIPTLHRQRVESIEIPVRGNAELVIVSAMLADAARELGMETLGLASPSGMVRDEEGRIVGCTSLVRY